MNAEAERDPDQDERAGPDLNLALEFKGRACVGDDRQTGFLPTVETAIEHPSRSVDPIGEAGAIGVCPHACPAMEDDFGVRRDMDMRALKLG